MSDSQTETATRFGELDPHPPPPGEARGVHMQSGAAPPGGIGPETGADAGARKGYSGGAGTAVGARMEENPPTGSRSTDYEGRFSGVRGGDASDVVQDRPAGGTPDEVAAANPGLAQRVPEAVGQTTEGGAQPAAGMRLEDGSGMEMPELAVQSSWSE